MSGRPANPYPGPCAFETKDSDRFFGRTAEIRRLGDLAVARRVVLLYAVSGAGKTSLLSAGLVPHLRKTLPMARVLPIARVSGDPPAELPVADVHVWNVLSAILEDGTGPAEIAGLPLREGVERLLAGEIPEEGSPPAFLILDQLEELFQDGRGEPRAFFQQLRETLAARPELSLVLALREEALAQLDSYRTLFPDQLRTRFRLELLGPEAALRAVEDPARGAGIPFAPGAARQLVDDLRRSLAESPEGTAREGLGAWVDPAQLQVVCHRIWESLPAEAGEIDEARAHAVGSFDEILARHYEERLRDVERETGVPEKALRRWIGQLVTPQGLRDQVGREPGTTRGLDNRAVEALVDTHLVRAERRRGMVWYELAHDRLVRPVLRSNERWREQNRSLLERQADLWAIEGKRRRRLLRGRELASAEKRLAEGLEEKTEVIQEFLDACRRARRRRLWIWGIALGLPLLLLPSLGGFGVALVEIGLSGASSILLNLENEILRRRDGELDLALLLGVSALEAQKNLAHFADLGLLDTDTRRLLFQALEASPHLEAFLPAGDGEVTGLSFSPDGGTLSATTTAGSVASWDLATRRLLSTPDGSLRHAGPEPPALTVTVAGPRGETVVTAQPDGTLLFQHPGDAGPLPRDGGVGPVARLAASPDGEVVAVGGATGRIAIWDLRHGHPPAILTGKTAPLHALAFSPDSAWLASGHGRTVVLWRRDPLPRLGRIEDGEATAAAPKPVQARTALPESLCPAPAVTFTTLSKGPFTAAGCSDGTLLLRFRVDPETTVQTPVFLQPLPVQRIAIAPDAGSLAAATSDGAVWALDLMGRRVFAGPLRGHRGPVAALEFEDPGGLRLLSTGTDGRRIHWDLDPASWRRIACGIAGRNMAESEHSRLPYPFLVPPATCFPENP